MFWRSKGRRACGIVGRCRCTVHDQAPHTKLCTMLRCAALQAMALKSKGITLTLKDGSTAATGKAAKSGGRGRGRCVCVCGACVCGWVDGWGGGV